MDQKTEYQKFVDEKKEIRSKYSNYEHSIYLYGFYEGKKEGTGMGIAYSVFLIFLTLLIILGSKLI